MSSELLESLVHAGNEVIVYADLVTETYVRNGVHIKPRGEFKRIGRSCDLIYSHPDVGTIGYIAAELQRVPYVAVVHNTGQLNRWHLEHHKPTLTVWNSEATKEQLGGKDGIVCHSPLRVADHKTKRGDAVTLINLIEAKGFDTWAGLIPSMPWARWLGIRGGYGHQETQRAYELGAQVIGPVLHTDMAKEVWSQTKLLLAPSREESWGRVAAEALCSGIPVIAHPTPGLVECLGDAGIFIDRDKTAEWRKAVEQLLSDPKAYGSASRRATARARFLEAQSIKDQAAFIEALENLVRR